MSNPAHKPLSIAKFLTPLQNVLCFKVVRIIRELHEIDTGYYSLCPSTEKPNKLYTPVPLTRIFYFVRVTDLTGQWAWVINGSLSSVFNLSSIFPGIESKIPIGKRDYLYKVE